MPHSEIPTIILCILQIIIIIVNNVIHNLSCVKYKAISMCSQRENITYLKELMNEYIATQHEIDKVENDEQNLFQEERKHKHADSDEWCKDMNRRIAELRLERKESERRNNELRAKRKELENKFNLNLTPSCKIDVSKTNDIDVRSELDDIKRRVEMLEQSNIEIKKNVESIERSLLTLLMTMREQRIK